MLKLLNERRRELKTVRYLLNGLAFFLIPMSGILAGLIEDFKSKPEVAVYQGDERGMECSIEKAPKKGEKNLCCVLAWTKNHANIQEIFLKKEVPFSKKMPLKGKITFKIYTKIDNPEQIASVNVRLKDSSSEVFQWTKKLKLENGKWQKITIPLDIADAKGHWGGNNNGKIDDYVSLSGFSFYIGDKSPKGKLYLDDIKYKK